MAPTGGSRPCREGSYLYPDSWVGGVHTPRHPALGAQRTLHFPVLDSHAPHFFHRASEPHRGLQLARPAGAPEPTGARAFPTPWTQPSSAPWDSGASGDVFGP